MVSQNNVKNMLQSRVQMYKTPLFLRVSVHLGGGEMQEIWNKIGISISVMIDYQSITRQVREDNSLNLKK